MIAKQRHIKHQLNKAYVFLALCLFFMSSFSSVGQAAKFSGEYLLKVCSVDRNGHEVIEGGKIACQGYISGVIDYHNVLRATGLPTEMRFCIPKDETLNEIHIRVLAYLYKHRKLHQKFVAAPAVAMGLMSAYPCK